MTNPIKSTGSNKYGHGIEPNAAASEKASSDAHSAGAIVTAPPTKHTKSLSTKDGKR